LAIALISRSAIRLPKEEMKTYFYEDLRTEMYVRAPECVPLISTAWVFPQVATTWGVGTGNDLPRKGGTRSHDQGGLQKGAFAARASGTVFGSVARWIKGWKAATPISRRHPPSAAG